MRPVIIVAVLTSLMLIPPVRARAQVLKNPSFEEADAAEDLAAGWERWGQWINRETGWEPVRSGSCILAYHHWRRDNDEDSGVYQDVAGAEAGRKYTFAIYANADRAGQKSEDAEGIELRLESTVDGKQVTVGSRTYRVDELATGTKWKRLEVSGTSVNGTLRVLLVLTPSRKDNRGGALKFDDASLSGE